MFDLYRRAKSAPLWGQSAGVGAATWAPLAPHLVGEALAAGPLHIDAACRISRWPLLVWRGVGRAGTQTMVEPTSFTDGEITRAFAAGFSWLHPIPARCVIAAALSVWTPPCTGTIGAAGVSAGAYSATVSHSSATGEMTSNKLSG